MVECTWFSCNQPSSDKLYAEVKLLRIKIYNISLYILFYTLKSGDRRAEAPGKQNLGWETGGKQTATFSQDYLPSLNQLSPLHFTSTFTAGALFLPVLFFLLPVCSSVLPPPVFLCLVSAVRSETIPSLIILPIRLQLVLPKATYNPPSPHPVHLCCPCHMNTHTHFSPGHLLVTLQPLYKP